MNLGLLGMTLIVLGILIYIVPKFFQRKNIVIAKSGSVVIQGNNAAPIQAINISAAEKPSHQGRHVVTYFSIVIEIIGIGTTIWHAMHLGAK